MTQNTRADASSQRLIVSHLVRVFDFECESDRDRRLRIEFMFPSLKKVGTWSEKAQKFAYRIRLGAKPLNFG
jgi:hypothetical protein